jgi:hypothetical protein
MPLRLRHCKPATGVMPQPSRVSLLQHPPCKLSHLPKPGCLHTASYQNTRAVAAAPYSVHPAALVLSKSTTTPGCQSSALIINNLHPHHISLSAAISTLYNPPVHAPPPVITQNLHIGSQPCGCRPPPPSEARGHQPVEGTACTITATHRASEKMHEVLTQAPQNCTGRRLSVTTFTASRPLPACPQVLPCLPPQGQAPSAPGGLNHSRATPQPP